MAVLHSDAPRHSVFVSFASMFAQVWERIDVWQRNRAIRRELLALSDRELNDLGISRYDIMTRDFAGEPAHAPHRF